MMSPKLSSTSQDRSDETNFIKKCIQNSFDRDNFAKFQQMLDYMDDKQCSSIYQELNTELFTTITVLKDHLPPDLSVQQYIQMKAKFYSFLFIKRIGKLIIKQINNDSPKASENFLTLSKILLFHGLTSKGDTANLALVELEQLCQGREIALNALYNQYRAKFLKLIIKAILHKLMSKGDDDNGRGDGPVANGSNSSSNRHNAVVLYMTRALEVFDVVTITKEDVAQSLIITTNLIHKEKYNDAIKQFLEHLAAYQNIDINILIRSHIQTILVSLLLKRKLSHFDITASLTKLGSFCGKTPKELLATKFTFIKGRLLLNYSVDPKCVTDGIYYLSKFEKEEHDQPFEEELDDEKSFIDYLKPSMIGMLLGIDSHFNANGRDFGSDESIKHIESISKLLTLIDDTQVEAIHVKLLSTLSSLISLRQQRDNLNLNQAILKLWTIFVSKLRDSVKKNLIVNICIVLYDLVDNCPNEVAQIYEDLLCGTNSPDIRENFKSLFFIQDTPSMRKVYKHLNPYVRRENTVSSLDELLSVLECTKPLFKFENQKSRYLGLCKIRDVLEKNQDLLTNKMLTSLDEPLHSNLSAMIESLIALCSATDLDCLALIAECFGLIGAVNPIRLDHLMYGQISVQQLICTTNLSDAAFIVALIERLKSSLFSDQRSESETASYALQVVINVFSVFKNEKIRGSLSTEALRACQLCQNTNYSGTKTVKTEFSSSMYGKFLSESNFSYTDWLDRFSLNLISTIREKKLQEVLYACSYVFRYNGKFAEFVLIHTIVHIIIFQPTHVVLIKAEIMAILQEDIGVSTQDLDDLSKDTAKGNVQALHIKCANLIFFILDVIHRLDCETRGLKPNITLRDHQVESIRDFIDYIPKDKLALLASKCRSHVRALYYFEQFLFSKKSQLNNYATALQKIHVALDDPYEASGTDTVRTTPSTVFDDVSNYEASGRFDKAFICCSTILDGSSDCAATIEEALRCLANQGDYQRLYEKSRLLLDDQIKYKRCLLPYAIEATWKLSKWDELTNYIKRDQVDNMLDIAPVSQGLLLQSINESRALCSQWLKRVRYELIKPLAVALLDQSAYFRGYQSLLVLHSLGDLSFCLKMLEVADPDSQPLDENTIEVVRTKLNSNLDRLFGSWTRRNRLVQPSLRSLEPLLEWQRSICLALARQYPFIKSRIDLHVGELWLESADAAREARSYDRAFFSVTQARRWFGSELSKLSLDLRVKYHIEQAKLDWDQGEQTKAIRGLKLTLSRLSDHKLCKHLIERHQKGRNQDPFPQLNNLPPCKQCSSFEKSERETFALLKMLITHYSEESASEIPETLFYMYEECVHLGVNQEETYFRLARYYDKLLTYYIDNPTLCGEQAEDKTTSLFDATQRFSQNLVSGDKEEVYTKLMEHSIIAFGNSLKYGATHIRESMPRMLNLWYDLGSRKTKTGTTRLLSSRIETTVRFVDELKNKILPPYYFMTAISIILSRIAHPHSGISKKTCEILELLLFNYPNQITWLMIALVNEKLNENHDRIRAAKTILSSCRRKGGGIEKIVRDTMEFSKLIMELCSFHTSRDVRPDRDRSERKKLTGKVHIKDIHPGALKFKFSEARVVAPIQATIRAIIPTDTAEATPDKHVVFPEQSMYLVRDFDTSVKVFNSLQQPRQVTLKCDNGRSVSIICKAGDDLRKDSRCIEFLNLLNAILRRDSQSNVRFLDIQTFLVLPLGDDIGIIEMVPNCESLRSIIEPLYKERKLNFSMNDQFPKKDKGCKPNEQKDIFEKVVLPKTSPPVLPTWFLRRYTDPTSWYMARLAFTRSAAVSSMGGYIIGLGDRHLDNILIDTNTGKVVHVDFNLLFHQGELLQVPERVPFRLTHNLIAAFGSMGTEGNFRRVSEIAMRVMRKEKGALLTTLKPFMHDPCTEWVKVREARNRIEPEDKHAENKSAKFRIEVTERKLKGYPRSKHFKPLTLIDSYSVEAQVDNLIAEASDNFNLAQMYFGWCPHV